MKVGEGIMNKKEDRITNKNDYKTDTKTTQLKRETWRCDSLSFLICLQASSM